MFRPIQRIALTLSLFLTAAFPAFSQDQPNEFLLAEGTPLNVVTVAEISSKTADAGDNVNFKVVDDVKIGDHVIISKDTLVLGSVINAEPGRTMGRSGTLGIVVDSTTAVDGTPLKLRAAKGGKGDEKVVSTMLLSSITPFFMLRKGSDAKIAAGTPVTVYLAEERVFRFEDSKIVAKPAAVAATADPEKVAPVTVYVYRPGKMVGGALEPSVYVDDIELGRMDNGRYLSFRLTPGKHMVHMTDKKKGYLINMGPGETYYFRVGIEPGMWKGKGKLTLEESEKSLKELKKVKFLGADKIKDKNIVVEIAPPEPKPKN